MLGRIGGRGTMAQQVCVVVSAAERSSWLQSRATVIGAQVCRARFGGSAAGAAQSIGVSRPKDPQAWQGADRVIDEPEEVGR